MIAKLKKREHSRQRTLRELHEDLSRLLLEQPTLSEAPVYTQGCDCEGPCSGLKIAEEPSTFRGTREVYVVLLRDDGEP